MLLALSTKIMRSTYQDYLAKSLTERYHELSCHLDNTIKDANENASHLEVKLQGTLSLRKHCTEQVC